MSSPGGNSDDVVVNARMGEEEIAEALEDIRHAASAADRSLDELGRSGERSGRKLAEGMHRGERATKQARDAAGRFIPAARGAGEAADTSGRKARQGARGFDAYERQVKKATRSLGGFGAMLLLIKLATFLTAGLAIVGMLGALAAGAAMAVGALAPMVGIVGALGPGLFLLAGIMGILKISGADLKAIFNPLIWDFVVLRTEITRQLLPGMTSLVTKLRGSLIPAVTGGMISLAGFFGSAADKLGDLLSEATMTNQVGEIFQGLDPVLQSSAGVLGYILRIVVALALAALPMATRMAAGLERVTKRLSEWLDLMVASGRAQAWFNRSWDTAISAGAVLKNFLIGLYHIFRLAGQVAREELGGGIQSAAARFREWTESTAGQERILRFFRESVPAIRETVKLLGAMAAGIGHLAANEDVAPLLAQIRTELLPALGRLIDHITEAGGLGPGLISMFTAIATALSMIPLDGLLWIIQGITGLAWAIAWLVTEVPGLGPVLGFVLSLAIAGGTLGKLAGLFFLLGRGLMFFAGPLRWVGGLLAPMLTRMGLLGFLMHPIARLAPIAASALRLLGGALLFVGRSLLFLAISNPITAAIMIVIGILLLLWFHWDGFRGAIMTGLRAIGDFFLWIWSGIGPVVMGVFNGIWAVVKFVFGVIVGIVQIAVFVIVGILVGILTLGKMIFEGIGFAASKLWEYVLKPVFDAIAWGFWMVVGILVGAWSWFYGILSAGASAVYNAVIAPLMVYWMMLWSFLTTYIFGPIGDAGSWVWDKIAAAATWAANTISGIMGGVMSVVRGVYNFIAGGWNAIPGYTVPDWIPGIGGKHFGLPKLPLLAEGGTIEYSTALVGEEGPEALVKGGRVLGMLGAHGPEIATGLPPGGYVVPNLDTLNRLPGLTRQIPAGVADAVSRALPHYRPALGRDATPASDVHVQVDTGSDQVVEAVDRLTDALLSRRRRDDGDGDPVGELRRALDEHDRRKKTSDRYRYASPRG